MVPQTRLHAELLGLLCQHSHFADQRHLVLLSWMLDGLLLSQTVCFDRWKTVLPLGHCLAASWQRCCQRWLNNSRIDPERLYSPLILWTLQHWQKPGQHLYLALDTTMLWNRCCVVVLSVVAHGRAIPLVWRTLEHPSASVVSRQRKLSPPPRQETNQISSVRPLLPNESPLIRPLIPLADGTLLINAPSEPSVGLAPQPA